MSRQTGHNRIVAAPFVLIALFLSAFAAARRARRTRLPGRAVIMPGQDSTVMARDGAVRSVQSAELTMDPCELQRLWNPANLENLGRTYWRFLSRVTLGLIRVKYGEHSRSVVFLGRPLTLLRFDAPEYVVDGVHGAIRWRIRDGLLVARSGRGSGYLALDVRCAPIEADGRAKVRIEVEVANFYPAIAVGFSAPVYKMTQAAIHILVTHAFLRSLAKLQLAESKIGRLAEQP
ncbi:MAG TPA: hypothetical protein VGH45_07740 [Solirubrobacteraceae bacterium]